MIQAKLSLSFVIISLSLFGLFVVLLIESLLLTSFVLPFVSVDKPRSRDGNTTTVIMPTEKKNTTLSSQQKRILPGEKAIGSSSSKPHLQQVMESLEAMKNIKYYIYTHGNTRGGRNIASSNKQSGKSATASVIEEVEIIELFESNHSLRTFNHTDADIFILPLSLVGVRGTEAYDRAFDTMIRHPAFLRTGGHFHILFALEGRFFEAGGYGKLSKLMGAKWPKKLENVTIVKNHDIYNIQQMLVEGQELHGDWQQLFQSYRPTLKHSFSIGIQSAASLPVISASIEHYQSAPFDVFFRYRKFSYGRNSTPYRLAANALQELSSSFNMSIGEDLPPDLWIAHFTGSKFCLVIRGDTPNSAALIRSVKVGCIPIVVSDYYERYAPAFKSSLSISDYAIFIPEALFVTEPVQQVRRILENQTLANEKLQSLRWAQRILLYDHPQSLFVQAFLREAMEAQRHELRIYPPRPYRGIVPV